MLKPLYGYLHSIGGKSGPPPESRVAMNELSLPIKRVGNQSQGSNRQSSKDNARPNKNCPNHNLLKCQMPKFKCQIKSKCKTRSKIKIIKYVFISLSF